MSTELKQKRDSASRPHKRADVSLGVRNEFPSIAPGAYVDTVTAPETAERIGRRFNAEVRASFLRALETGTIGS